MFECGASDIQIPDEYATVTDEADDTEQLYAVVVRKSW